MILKYQKVLVQYDEMHSSTIVIVEPDYSEDDTVRAVELCTIDGYTYVYWPGGLTIPDQPTEIVNGIGEVTLTDELKTQIKDNCPHVKLSYQRLRDRIRSVYSIDDEQYFSRISIGSLSGTYTMQDDEPGEITAYQTLVEESRETARLERVALGLG